MNLRGLYLSTGNIHSNNNEIIARVSVHGQYKIDREVFEKINQIDNEIVWYFRKKAN